MIGLRSFFYCHTLSKPYPRLVETNGSMILDGSLRLLDVCGIIKDALLQTKECTHELQSIMHRRRGGDMSFMSEVRKYLASRKDVNKAMNKAFKVKKS
ncbi:unnamed protein product [Prunus armeniaca]